MQDQAEVDGAAELVAVANATLQRLQELNAAALVFEKAAADRLVELQRAEAECVAHDEALRNRQEATELALEIGLIARRGLTASAAGLLELATLVEAISIDETLGAFGGMAQKARDDALMQLHEMHLHVLQREAEKRASDIAIAEQQRANAPAWVDPDDAPELGDEFFERAVAVEPGGEVNPKQPDADPTSTDSPADEGPADRRVMQRLDLGLLTVAADVAGVKYNAEASQPNTKSGAWWGLWLTFEGEPSEYARRYWNPLHNDGDALRLAVALRIALSFEKLHTVSAYTQNDEWLTEYCTDGMGADISEKTRRAIVRAAVSMTPNPTSTAAQRSRIPGADAGR